MSWSTPDAGAGISASTLSVEISNNGSSRWILSPGFFSHLVIVPSTMDSPIWGITMSVGMISFHPGPVAKIGPEATCNYSEGGLALCVLNQNLLPQRSQRKSAEFAKKNKAWLCVLCGFSLRSLRLRAFDFSCCSRPLVVLMGSVFVLSALMAVRRNAVSFLPIFLHAGRKFFQP